MIINNKFNNTISKNNSLSKTNIRYLRKIIDFCQTNKVKIFLIRSPQHPLYGDLRNELVYQNVLKKSFNDVDLLDFNNMKFPNSHYLDLHHLNYKGATKFSLMLNNLTQNGLLESDNKQAIINQAIKSFN